MAADPASAALFVGLGASELSMPPKAIAPVRAVIGCHSINELGQLARKALDCSDAGQVRRLVADLVMDQKPWPVTLHLPHGPETSPGL